VPYDDITAVELRGQGLFQSFCLTTHRRFYLYPRWSFFERKAMARALHISRERVWALADGPQRLAEMESKARIARLGQARPPMVTVGAVLILLVVFLCERLLGADQDLLGLIALGANAPALVAKGQVHRLVAANFIHLSWVHLYLSGLALLSLGNVLERIVGHCRFLVLLLCSAIGGSLASSLAAQGALSLGSSTAVFGLLGSLIFLLHRLGEELPSGYRQPRWWWALVVSITAALPFLQPQPDIAAHVGGFICGVVTTFLLYPGRDANALATEAGRRLRTAAAALVSLCVVAGGVTAHGAAYNKEQDKLTVAADLVQRLSTPQELHKVALQMATDPTAPPEQVELALNAAQQAVGQIPHEAAALHALATAQYRRGLLDEAIATERRARLYDDHPRYVTQLAHLLDARSEQRGLLLLGDVTKESLSIHWEPAASSSRENAVIRISMKKRFDHPVVVVAHVLEEQRPVGVFLAILKPDYGGGINTFHPWLNRRPWPAQVTFDVALVDASGTGPEPLVPAFGYYPLDPKTRTPPGSDQANNL
jgi:rhomboid protease GluP